MVYTIVIFKKFKKYSKNTPEDVLIQGGIYQLKVNNKNSRTRCEMCSVLTIRKPERQQRRRSGVFIVNFVHIHTLFLVFPLLTLNKFCPLEFSKVTSLNPDILKGANFENNSWQVILHDLFRVNEQLLSYQQFMQN